MEESNPLGHGMGARMSQTVTATVDINRPYSTPAACLSVYTTNQCLCWCGC